MVKQIGRHICLKEKFVTKFEEFEGQIKNEKEMKVKKDQRRETNRKMGKRRT